MKHIKRIALSFCLIFILSACASNQQISTTASLTVRGDSVEKQYTISEIKGLPATQAEWNGVAYLGVRLRDLLTDAGIDVSKLSAVKVIASDGFTVNYDASIFLAEDTLVAYERAEGPLSEEEGAFRMVVPSQGGKMNPRMIVEIQAIP